TRSGRSTFVVRRASWRPMTSTFSVRARTSWRMTMAASSLTSGSGDRLRAHGLDDRGKDDARPRVRRPRLVDVLVPDDGAEGVGPACAEPAIPRAAVPGPRRIRGVEQLAPGLTAG